MRTGWGRRAGVAVPLAALLVLGACTSKNDEPGAAGEGGGDGVVVAFVPKVQGIPYFEAMNTGGRAAAEQLGGIEWRYQGPTQGDAAAQTQIVRSFIQQGVDAIAVAPNDPYSIAPVLAEAERRGIAVLTTDTDAPNSVRSAFVNQATAESIGRALTDQLLEPMGGEGRYAIVSCGETAENLNSWIEVQRAYTAEKYPEAEIVDVVYAGEDQGRATQMATDLMNAHPDLTGLVGECTSSAPGVAQAVRDAGRIGQVHTVGVGTPQAMQGYLADGSSAAAVLWDVEQLGYLTAWAGRQAATGQGFAASNDIAPELAAVSWDETGKTLLLGDPLILTRDNVADYDY